MALRDLLGRIRVAVREHQPYLAPADAVPAVFRAKLEQVATRIADPAVAPDEVNAEIARWQELGLLPEPEALSALGVVAAHPRVSDYVEAARLAGEQELAALELGGPELERRLAAVCRHRGVISFLRADHESALEHFTLALGHEHSVENLGNVLAALLALGELSEAQELLGHVRASFPAELVSELELRIQSDADLAKLAISGH